MRCRSKLKKYFIPSWADQVPKLQMPVKTPNLNWSVPVGRQVIVKHKFFTKQVLLKRSKMVIYVNSDFLLSCVSFWLGIFNSHYSHYSEYNGSWLRIRGLIVLVLPARGFFQHTYHTNFFQTYILLFATFNLLLPDLVLLSTVSPQGRLSKKCNLIFPALQ